MRARIRSSDARGAASVPGSKSYTIRAALCAAMAAGKSLIEGALESDDSNAVFECIEALGAEVSQSSQGIAVKGGRLRPPAGPLWCRESGATFRFLSALAATVPGRTVLQCAPSLARRPMQPLVDAIRQLGIDCQFDPVSGTLVVEGQSQRTAHVTLRGDISSQFLSAMVLSGPRYSDGLHIDVVSPIVSERYVRMTIECMRRFDIDVCVMEHGRGFVVPGDGYLPTHYIVEGDWSGAAAILALGALAGDVSVSGLEATSLQADATIVELLSRMGASVNVGANGVRVVRSELRACTFDLAESIDLLPVGSALAAAAEGMTRLSGIARARDKESDRVAAMADGLRALGVRVEVGEDEIRVWGGAAHGGVVSSAGDHRIAMAFGVLGALVGDIVVEDAECVAKTYPRFWETMSGLGVEVEFDEQ